MSPILPAAIRTGLQVWWGALVAWLATLGITLPPETSQLVENALLATVTALVVAGLRWLETRQGDGWESWARRVAGWLMLGMSGSQPTYPSVDPKAKNGTR
jgi:hypothetical protein